MNKNTDWFCKCCKEHYNRENATLLCRGGIEELCYQVAGMCTICYKEANYGHEFGSVSTIDNEGSVEEVLLTTEQIAERTRQIDVIMERLSKGEKIE